MEYAYVQVATTIMASRATEDREYRSFEHIRDNYPKYLLTRSDLIQQRNGIIHANIPEFMLAGSKFHWPQPTNASSTRWTFSEEPQG